MSFELSKIEYNHYRNSEKVKSSSTDEKGIIVNLPNYHDLYDAKGEPVNLDVFHSLESCIWSGYLIMGCILNDKNIINFIDNNPNVVYVTNEDYIQYFEEIPRDGDIDSRSILMEIVKLKFETLENKNSLFIYLTWNEVTATFSDATFYYVDGEDLYEVKISYTFSSSEPLSQEQLLSLVDQINFLHKLQDNI